MRTVAFLFSLLFCASTFAATVYVANTTGTDVANVDLASATELLKDSIQSRGHKLTTDAKSADYRVDSKLLKLGDAFVLTATKTSKNGKTFSTRMKAKTMMDMDTVAGRVVSALDSEKALDDTADVTNISEEEETRNTRRYQATRQWLIGIGPGWTSGLKSSGGGLTFSLGYLWGLDPDFGVSLVYTHNGGQGDDDSSFNDFSVGGEYFFSRNKFSPLVGARLGYGSVTRNGCGTWLTTCTDGTESGWNVNVNAGYKFFRTSTVNVGILGSYTQSFASFDGESPNLGALQVIVYY